MTEPIDTCDGCKLALPLGVIYSDEHQSSREHAEGLARTLSDEGWSSFKDAIDNGLAWAESESMGSEIWDRSEVAALLGFLIESYRSKP